MKQKKPIDDIESPELTDAFFKKAVPFYELHPQFKPTVNKEAEKTKKPTPRHLHAA